MKRKVLLIAVTALLMTVLFAGCASRSAVKLGQYKGLTYTPQDATVTQEEVDEYIRNVITDNSEDERDPSRDGTKVVEGDKINVDYVGSIDGVEFEGGNSMGQGVDITIGLGAMIPGFEEGLIGKTIGEKTVIDVTFPNPYSINPALAGKDAQFEIDIHFAYKVTEPEYNDTFVYELTQGQYSTVKEYEMSVRTDLEAQKQKAAEQKALEEILKQALAGCTFSMNPKDMYQYHDEFITYYQQMADMYGYTLEDYIATMGTTTEALEDAANRYAQDSLASRLFYQKVAETEGLTVTEEEYEARIGEYLTRLGYEGNREAFEQEYGLDLIRENMLYDIVNEKLLEWSVPKN
ncbi:MAG: trigger factor [Clostridia bacterium]|nr:trigger factor [Clostridia bacterium]